MSQAQGIDIRAMHRALEDEREALNKSSASTTQDRIPVELDQQSVGRLSRIDAIQVQEMAHATETRRKARLQRIVGALKRIKDGTFGECLECGEGIAPKRLELDPTATHCIDCAD